MAPAERLPPELTGARVPADELERLVALRRSGLLDPGPCEAFDRVTRLAAQALSVPIVLVSLVDEHRQWFKSRFGLDVAQTSREASFCAHAVAERAPLVVPDATLDERFRANPLVVGAPHIRAYLGVPLFTRQGYAVGTLCAIDTKTRGFDTQALRTFNDYAKLAEECVRARELEVQTDSALALATKREALFRDTFELAAVGIAHTGLTGEVFRINRRACEMLGYTEGELSQISFVDITHPEDIGVNADLVRRLAAGEIDSYRVEKRYLRKNGAYLWTQLSVALRRNPSGEPNYLIAVIEDIAARKEAEAKLVLARDDLQTRVAQQTHKLNLSNDALKTHVKRLMDSDRRLRRVEHRLRGVANSVPALISYWNRDLVCEFANEMYREWFGLDPEQTVGMSLREFLGAAQFSAVELYLRLVLEGRPQRFDSTRKTVSGEDAFLDVRYIPDFNESREVKGFYVLITDTTPARNVRMALEAANARLTSESATDYLTGLANRRVFSQQSDVAFERFAKEGERYGMILLDLDDFKQINDVFGHDVGDDVLLAVGKVLRRSLRDHQDIAARLGGEEFAVLCFDAADEASLRVTAERIREHINKETLGSNKGAVRFTASFGLATSEVGDSGWKGVYSRADAALYEAKTAGKDRVTFGRVGSPASTGRIRSLRIVPTK